MSSSNLTLTYLRDQIARLLDVLDREYSLLGQGSMEELERLQSAKLELMNGLSGEANLLEQDARKRQSESWTEFLGLVEKCRHRNLVNGAAMQEMLRLRRSALEMLLGREKDEGHYKEDGRLRGGAQQRTLGQA